MPTLLSTISVCNIIGLECTHIWSKCVMPVQVALFPTPQKTNHPNSCITFQSRRLSWSCLLMHILQESIWALIVRRYTWLHAVAILALPLWNPYSMLIPKNFASAIMKIQLGYRFCHTIVLVKDSKFFGVCSEVLDLLQINCHVLSDNNHNPMMVKRVN